MTPEPHDRPSRRDVLKAGAAIAATAATARLARGEQSASSAPASQAAVPLPTRTLGRTGEKVTVLNLGCGGAPTQRLLDHAYARGVRCFDTAGGYANGRSEQEIGKWFERTGKRKEIFLVTKDGSSTPKTLLSRLDERLAALKTDYIDMYCLHGMGDNEKHTPDLAKSDEYKEAAEQLRKTGKVRFVGFSIHTRNIPEYLMAAAGGGFLDGIMMSYSPVTGKHKDEALDRALDACHKAGIGLIAMKTMRGMTKSVDMEALNGLTVHQAVIQGVLSDERIATICSAMSNFNQLDQNTEAARLFKGPLSQAELDGLRQRLIAAGYAFCPGCPACRSGIAGTSARVHDILRYLSYYEQDGRRALARQMYRALSPAERDFSGADLAAAREACSFHVDYGSLLRRAEQMLA